jgi:hypothetical protein
MKRLSPILAAMAMMGLALGPVEGQAQQVPDWLVKLKLPNSGAKSIMTPSAYGAAFVGAGVVDRTPYLPTADGVVGLGYGMGDPVLNAGLQLGTTVSDLSEFSVDRDKLAHWHEHDVPDAKRAHFIFTRPYRPDQLHR